MLLELRTKVAVVLEDLHGGIQAVPGPAEPPPDERTLPCVLKGWCLGGPSLDHGAQQLPGKIRTALQEAVECEITVLLGGVPEADRAHQLHVIPHQGTKCACPGDWCTLGLERFIWVSLGCRSNDRSNPAQSVALAQGGEGVRRQCASLDEKIKKATYLPDSIRNCDRAELLGPFLNPGDHGLFSHGVRAFGNKPLK
ncbi:MAG TPA: hypothetical protein VNE82_21710 [Candidatus Binataceae bacterium]|nr:hypothetical protein [Candidatus Binataceae bacterium]